jgi:glutathione synthase/RimK-type ligase-like ATP-grasp enzyme
VYLQQFIADAGYDLRVVVVGDRLSAYGRRVPVGDFRASGDGDVFYDRSLITPEVIDAAFSASDALGARCMGYDFVLDPKTSKPYIVEMSYGFPNWLVREAEGSCDRLGVWSDEPLDAAVLVLRNLVASAESAGE